MNPLPGPPRPPALGLGTPRLRTAPPRARPGLNDLFQTVPVQKPEPAEPNHSTPPSTGQVAPPRGVLSEYQIAFLEEARGELQALAALLEREDWLSVISHIRRRFHTIRGAAATLDFPQSARLAAEAEALADAAESGKTADPSATSEGLRALAAQIATGLDLTISFPAPAGRSPESGQREPFSAPREAGPVASPADAAISPAPASLEQGPPLSDLLDHWCADQQGAHAAFLEAIAAYRLRLESEQTALAKSLAQLEELVRDWGSRPPPLAMSAVLRRCLEDAASHQSALATQPSLPWRRRWHLIFRSLRIALASEWNSPPAPLSSAASPAANTELDPEMVAAFLEEAQTLLEPIETATLAWERGEDPSGHRAELRRHFHTLKGAANSVGLRALGSAMHHAEDLLQSGDPGPDTPAWLMARLDELRAHLEALASDPTTAWPYEWALSAAPSADPAPAASAPARPSAPGPIESPTLRIPAERLRAVMDTAAELLAGQVQAGGMADEFNTHRRDLDALRARVIVWAEDERAGRPPGAEAWQALEQALATASSRIAALRQSHQAAQAGLLMRARRIQNELADFNMAPVSGLFRRLQRVFRDALQAEQKSAELVTEGGRTRLDREITERLYGPLLHLLRNAVAHGIEPPDERSASGKPPAGRVRLAAIPQPGAVVFEVEDDGAGIRTDAVRRRAIARRLLPEDTASITDEDAVRLLFTPGFSTKEAANEVAGRGVGLDVVKAEVEGMGGTVTVRSSPGRGALWAVRVPLNLSTTEALMVRAGALHAAIPLACVVRCLGLKPDSLREESGRIFCPEAGLPYYALHELLGSSAGEDPLHGIVVDGGVFRAVLGVHHLGARREVVRKDPGPLLGQLPFLAGVVPEADGTLVSLLQIPELLRRLGAAEAAVAAPLAAPLRVLVADDSPSVRRAHQKLLEKIGCRAEVVADGAAALIKLKEEPFDLLLTDLEMPGMDGLDLVRALRRDPAHSDLRAIVVTSRRETSLIRALADAGASWLPKPLDAATLRAALSAPV